MFIISLVMPVLFCHPFHSSGQVVKNTPPDDFIRSLMMTKPDQFEEILKNPDKYRLQIIYTAVDRDEQNRPRFTRYTFRLRPDEYFYPASTVKMALAALTLEKLNKLSRVGIDRNTRLSIEKSYSCQTAVDSDKLSATGYPSLASSIERAMVVSDNVAYNRMYEFLGQRYINKRLKQTGLKRARIIHRLSYCNPNENRHTNAFRFYNNQGELLYRQKPAYNRKKYRKPLKDMKVGKGYLDADGKLINCPMDFGGRNYFPLDELTEVLKKIIFPESYPEKRQFHFSKSDRDFLLKQISIFPFESSSNYLRDTSRFFPSMTNYLFYGHDRNIHPDSSIRIYNIVGQAYGFLTDCAYFVDFNKNIEFFLSATIYTNDDGILNDDKYEYETVGFPFLKNLGLLFYEYEIQRPRQVQPDLHFLKDLYGRQAE